VVNDRLVVIIGTGERDKALAGAMYAVNSLKHGWMRDVKLFFFGPSERLLLEDPDLQELVREFQRQERMPVACRFIADREGTDAGLKDLGVAVEFVGQPISDLIKDGYVPLVW
jgi:hypothetical protein